MVTQLDEAKAELLEEAAQLSRDPHSAQGVGAGPDGSGDPDPVDTRSPRPEPFLSDLADPESAGSVLRRYYRHVPFDDLTDRTAADVLGAMRSSAELAATRPQGTAKIRAFTPTRERSGWTTGETTHTVVEIATDDMPYSSASGTYCRARS